MMKNYVRFGQSEGNPTKSFCYIFGIASPSNLWLEQVTAIDCDTVSLEYLRQRGGGKLTMIQMDLEVWRFWWEFRSEICYEVLWLSISIGIYKVEKGYFSTCSI